MKNEETASEDSRMGKNEDAIAGPHKTVEENGGNKSKVGSSEMIRRTKAKAASRKSMIQIADEAKQITEGDVMERIRKYSVYIEKEEKQQEVVEKVEVQEEEEEEEGEEEDEGEVSQSPETSDQTHHHHS